jgi:hypothetical protein
MKRSGRSSGQPPARALLHHRPIVADESRGSSAGPSLSSLAWAGREADRLKAISSDPRIVAARRDSGVGSRRRKTASGD